MKTLEKLDKLLKPMMSLKEPSFGQLVQASQQAVIELEKMLLEEYEKGFADGKSEKVTKLIKEN